MKKHSPFETTVLTKRFTLWSLCLAALCYLGGLACNNTSGGSPTGNAALAVLEILNCPQDPLEIGEELQLQIEARDTQGQVLGSVSPQAVSNQPRYLETSVNGLVKALYPGEASVVASAQGIASQDCVITILPPENSLTAAQLTQNNEEDHWGMNNNWRMTAEGVVLWQHITAGGDIDILLHDRQDPLGVNEPIETVPVGTDVDFMALGAGAQDGEVLASYRVDLQDTKVSGDGAAPQNLGDRQQEENSITDGCFFFREGGGFNDIQKFSFLGGLDEIISAGETYGPLTSRCLAIWETRGAVTSELTFFDGQNAQTVAMGLPFFPQYDFRNGRIVYAKDGDVFLVDTTVQPFQVTPLTQDGLTVIDDFPKTDGNSVIWRQTDGADQHVVFFEIATGTREIISSSTEPKDGDTLQIDLKQASWLECTALPCSNANASLWFHDGSGHANGTGEVDTGLIPLEVTYTPYLMNGLLTWIGNDGDTEVFFLE